MQVLERTIEAKFVKRMKQLGCLAHKLNGLGNRGWPDRLVILPGGTCLFIELKAPRGKLSPKQIQVQDLLRAKGCRVQTFWNAEDAILYVEAVLRNEFGDALKKSVTPPSTLARPPFQGSR